MSAQPVCLSCANPTLVFVFGSNAQGNHAGGAAAHAYEKHGAEWGNGHGFQLRDGTASASWAIDTMSGFEKLRANVTAFLESARQNTGERYFVTAIGCGIAGYTPSQIAPLFADAPPNCILPDGWRTR